MASGILVVVEHDSGTPKKTAYELLSKAASLAGELGGGVSAVLIGSADVSNLGDYGASTVYSVDGESFKGYTTEGWTSALAAVIERADPAVVLAPASPACKDSFPRLAARKGFGMASEVTELSVAGGSLLARRPVYAGKAMVAVRIKSATALITVRPNSFGAGEATGGSSELVSVAVEAGAVRSKVVEQVEAATDVADLTEADRIVSGGRSLKSE